MKGERKILESKKGNIIRQIFINISHTRGLLWTDIVEGILFDQYGISRSLSNEVKVDESSLSNMMDLGSKENVVNYILVLDYLVDYLKNEYKLGNSEISKLVKNYLMENNITKLEMINYYKGSWIIPTEFIDSFNCGIIKDNFLNIFIWKIKSNLKLLDFEHFILKRQLSSKKYQQTIKENLISYVEQADKCIINLLFSINGNELWDGFIVEFIRFINQKKNSATSSVFI